MSSDILDGRSLQVIVGIFTIALFIIAALWITIDITVSMIVGGLAVILLYYALLSPGSKTTKAVTTPKVSIDKPISEDTESIEEVHVPEVIEPDVILQNLPIETIEGIGNVYGSKLKKEGIHTVQDLVKSNPGRISEICDVEENRASLWISMGRFAGLESISEEDAEAIVVATTIDSLSKLSRADPEEVLRVINNAVKDGHVEIPKDYEFTLDKVQRWIDEADELLNLDSI